MREPSAKRAKDDCGQMTVELCVVLPVAIVIAAIVINALAFFADCAEFDRVSRNAVRTYAASLGGGETQGDASAKILAEIEGAMSADNLECGIEQSGDWRGYVTYRMTVKYHPTLFGLGLKTEVFGVPMPALTHKTELTVSPYKPGVFL